VKDDGVDTKQEIVADWLPRYTGTPPEDMSRYVLLVNFGYYVHTFAEWHDVPIRDKERTMPNATANGISIINFGMGSANAATVIDLLSSIQPEAVLFLGKCGGLKRKNALGDLILPIAAIRGEGTSNDYFPLGCLSGLGEFAQCGDAWRLKAQATP
jgi:AMP nucleosidase